MLPSEFPNSKHTYYHILFFTIALIGASIGSYGIDNITGTPGNDRIIGNLFNENLKGNGGQDIITGGVGNDSFQIYKQQDKLTITDYESYEQIGLHGNRHIENGNFNFTKVNLSNEKSLPIFLFEYSYPISNL